MKLLLLHFALLIVHVRRVGSTTDFYESLGVAESASSSEIKKAYKTLAIKFHPDKNPSEQARARYLRIQEAYETLSNTDKRQEYDRLGKASQQRQEAPWSSWRTGFKPETPVLDRYAINSQVLQSGAAWLLQIYADSSVTCRFVAPLWEKAAKDLQGAVNFGRVHFAADPMLTAQLAGAGTAFSLLSVIGHQDLPLIIGFPGPCTELSCGVRFSGLVQPEALVQFAADRILRLPQVRNLARSEIDKFSSGAKVAMLVLSSGSRASFNLRRVALEHQKYIMVGRAAVNAQEREFWEEKYGIQKLPAVVFFLGPGSIPIVHDSSDGRKLDLLQLAASHQWPLVPELRHGTAHALGCGWGLGVDHKAQAQACAVLVGRNAALYQGRVKMAKLANFLDASKTQSAAAQAYRESNLRLVWLDAGRQYYFCKAHLEEQGAELVRSVCGQMPRWHSVLRFWKRWENSQIELIIYKPGAVRLSPWWSLPHRYAIFKDSSMDGPLPQLASWMASFLQGSSLGVVEKQEVPQGLEPEASWSSFDFHANQLSWLAAPASDLLQSVFAYTWSESKLIFVYAALFALISWMALQPNRLLSAIALLATVLVAVFHAWNSSHS